MPVKKTSALSFGSSLHEALAYLYGVKTPNPPTLEAVQEKLKEYWISEGYASESEEKQYFAHAQQVLANFYQTNIGNLKLPSDFKLPVVIEHKFGINLDGITVTGILDRLDKTVDGHYEVIDYKTNRKLPSQEKIDNDLQLSMYHWATEQIWGFTPSSVSLYFLLPNHRMISSRTDEQIKETLNTIKGVADKISNSKFEPVQSGLCPWCDFQQYCPYFSHKFTKSGEEIMALVEEYGQLKNQEKEIKSKAKEIAQQISAYLIDKKELRLFSENFEVLKSRRKSVTYDEKAIESLLHPLGLWEKVISLDNKKLVEILENGQLEQKIIQKISALSTTKESFALTSKKRTS